MRTLPITAAEVPVILAAIQSGEHVWLVREGRACDLPTLHDTTTHPPVEFTLACAPCEMCKDERHVTGVVGTNYEHLIDCPFCRIELAGPCPHDCQRFGGKVPGHGRGSNWAWVPCWCGGTGTVTLGHAHAVGQPLPILAFGDWLRDETVTANGVVVADGNAYVRGSGFPVPNITDRLAHYGPPESLVGKWAVELAVTA